MARPDPAESLLRTRPLRWFLQAAGVGGAVGLAVGMSLHARRPKDLAMNFLVGAIFSVVMWGGFDLLHDPFKDMKHRWSPERVGLYSVLWMLGLYTVLLAVAVGSVRLVTGFNLLGNAVVLTVTILAGLAVAGIVATKETVERQVAAERALARAEARAGFLALQAQLQPHTLFNALNTIAALIPEDPARAEEATEHLSALLRRILGALEREAWPLREEFDLLDHLLRLEALRFGDRLAYALELDPDMAERPVQPLLLLPLVENSLKHGFRPKVGPCRLAVRARGGRVRVEDDGVGRPEEAKEGVGLRTVRERVEAGGGALSWPPVARGCAVDVEIPA